MSSPVSTRAYHRHVKGDMENNQNSLVLKYMRDINSPCTIRMLHRIMNARGYEIDLVSLRRAVTNLSKLSPKQKWNNEWSKPMLRVAFERDCPISQVSVGWYELTENVVQLNLFGNKKAAA